MAYPIQPRNVQKVASFVYGCWLNALKSRLYFLSLAGTAAHAVKDVVHRDWPSAKEDEREGEGGQSEGKLVSVIAGSFRCAS